MMNLRCLAMKKERGKKRRKKLKKKKKKDAAVSNVGGLPYRAYLVWKTQPGEQVSRDGRIARRWLPERRLFLFLPLPSVWVDVRVVRSHSGEELSPVVSRQHAQKRIEKSEKAGI